MNKVSELKENAIRKKFRSVSEGDKEDLGLNKDLSKYMEIQCSLINDHKKKPVRVRSLDETTALSQKIKNKLTFKPINDKLHNKEVQDKQTNRFEDPQILFSQDLSEDDPITIETKEGDLYTERICRIKFSPGCEKTSLSPDEWKKWAMFAPVPEPIIMGALYMLADMGTEPRNRRELLRAVCVYQNKLDMAINKEIWKGSWSKVE